MAGDNPAFSRARRTAWPGFMRRRPHRGALAPISAGTDLSLGRLCARGPIFPRAPISLGRKPECDSDPVRRRPPLGGKPRILYVGSGQVYGEPQHPDQAFEEGSPLCPSSPYAASKAAADLASFQYARAPGLDIIRVRPFNHIGPRQSPEFAVSHFAKQIADIERKRRPPLLETGNLSSLRDLTDVRDMVRAYVLLMEKGRTGEAYNAAAGEVHSMQSVLDRLL